MDSETPAQLPVVQDTQPSALGQPIMFQMQPGQQQPVFIQVPAGHPATTPEGQPLQYFYIPVSQGAPGKPVESGQPVYIQGAPGQPVQQQPACPGGFDLNIDTGFLKSPLCFIKIAEFVSLLGAWASILKYLDGVVAPDLQHDANFFKGIMIFSWVVVIVYLIIYILSLPKTVCKCNRPSLFTITSVFFHFILFVLLLACTGNLVPKAVALGEQYRKLSSKISQYIVALHVALAFGFLSCILFVVDMVLNYNEFQTQRAQETSPNQGQQGPPQRRVWDINYEYLHSPLFNIKLAEVFLLLGAWVCILRYFGTGSVASLILASVEDSKGDFFRGITVFAWVMVILLALTVIFSLDKICSRSSPWTLLTLLFYFFLSILLIACCGNLTSRAVDLGKIYENLETESKSKAIALFIGLGLGYISWIIFLVDIYLIYKLYRQQRAEEFPYQQPAGQPVLQQPPVVIVAQGAGKQQFYQPVAHPGQQLSQYPGQQSSQYPGQQPVVIGAPPPPPPYGQNQPPPEPN